MTVLRDVGNETGNSSPLALSDVRTVRVFHCEKQAVPRTRWLAVLIIPPRTRVITTLA